MKPWMSVHVNEKVSPELAERITETGKMWASSSHRQRYDASEKIFAGYRRENGPPKKVKGMPRAEDCQILARLFHAVCPEFGPGKMGGPARWGVADFNYNLLNGRDKDLADIAWEYTDERGMKPSTFRSTVAQHTHKIAKELSRPPVEVCREVIEFMANRGGAWSPDAANSLFEHFGVGAFQKYRRHRAPAVEDMDENSRVAAIAVFEAYESFLREVELGAIDDAMLKADAVLELDLLVKSVWQRSMLHKSAKLQSDRARYTEECRTLGVDCPNKGFADLAEVRRVYRAKALQHHPDRNDGRRGAAIQFTAITAAKNFIDTYHDKYLDQHGAKNGSHG